MKFFQSIIPTDPFVGCAVFIKNNTPFHAGIVISIDSRKYLVHYTGQAIEVRDLNLEPLNSEIFVNVTNYIPPKDAKVLLAQCRVMKDNLVLKYNFVYDGWGFRNNNVIDITIPTPIATCVTFCAAAFKSVVLSPEFFEVEDWGLESIGTLNQDQLSILGEFVIEAQRSLPKEQFDQLFKNIRRIEPKHFFGAATCSFPATKIDIETFLRNNNLFSTVGTIDQNETEQMIIDKDQNAADQNV